MDRFKNILVAVSPGHLEPQTLRAAVKLAETNEANLTVLEVVPPMPRWHRRGRVRGVWNARPKPFQTISR